MRDTRLTHMRECLNEASLAVELKVRGLLRDVQKVMDELGEENYPDVHDRVDLEQAQAFLTAADERANVCRVLLNQAAAEFKQMEDRA